ncbi:13266_t:CDS:2, partial [Funneliformis geosporum]
QDDSLTHKLSKEEGARISSNYKEDYDNYLKAYPSDWVKCYITRLL